MSCATTRLLLLAVALAAQGRPVVAQAPEAPGRASEAAASGRGSATGAGSSRAGGRRDPFANPSRRRAPAPETARPPGLAGIAVDELTLRGIVLLAGAHLAVVETGNGRSHLLRGGERLFDGCVQSVAAGGVVIVQDGRRGAARAVRLVLGPSGEER